MDSILYTIFETSNNKKTTLNHTAMYMQLFITDRKTQKLSQFSCDNMNEVFDVLIKFKPKFIKIEYYDQFGLVGIGFQYFNFLADRYISYKKLPNLKH